MISANCETPEATGLGLGSHPASDCHWLEEGAFLAGNLPFDNLMVLDVHSHAIAAEADKL